MSYKHSVYWSYTSVAKSQLRLLTMPTLWCDKPVMLYAIGASRDSISAKLIARDAVRHLKHAGILGIVTQAAVLAKSERAIADSIGRYMADRQLLDLCDAQAQTAGMQRRTLSLAKVQEALQTYQSMRHVTGDFARETGETDGESVRSEMESEPARPMERHLVL